METLSGICRSAHDFGRAVVEWRSPATGPYLMAVNSIFWVTALYADAWRQQQLLVGLAAAVFSWDVLLSPSRDRSTLTHIALWPIASLWRSVGVVLSLYSTHLIRAGEAEQACIAAYSTVGCLLVNPVWQYYETSDKIRSGCCYAMNSAKVAAERGIVAPLRSIFAALKYVVLLQFIPPLLSYVKQQLGRLGGAIGRICRVIRDAILGTFKSISTFVTTRVLHPIRDAFYALGRWLRYWFFAEWWPDLKIWLREKIWRRLMAGFDYICYCMVYVVCGHWLPALRKWLGQKTRQLGRALRDYLLVPTKNWLVRQLRALSELTKSLLQKLAFAIRDSILWPVGILLLDAAWQLAVVLRRVLLQPVIDRVYCHYKVVEDYALIYVLGPTCETIINNIPEKSPFCDDSDVELEGFLPDAFPDEAEKESEPEPDSALEDDDFLPHDTPMDMDESEFTVGLAFPTIAGSESEDEEFSLQANRQPHRPKSAQRRHETTRVGGPERETPDNERIQPESAFLPSPSPQKTRQSKPSRKRPQDPDENFELL